MSPRAVMLCNNAGIALLVLGCLALASLFVGEKMTAGEVERKADYETAFESLSADIHASRGYRLAPPPGEPFSTEKERVYTQLFGRLRLPAYSLLLLGVGMMVLAARVDMARVEATDSKRGFGDEIPIRSQALFAATLVAVCTCLYQLLRMFSSSTDQSKQAFFSIVMIIVGYVAVHILLQPKRSRNTM